MPLNKGDLEQISKLLQPIHESLKILQDAIPASNKKMNSIILSDINQQFWSRKWNLVVKGVKGKKNKKMKKL